MWQIRDNGYSARRLLARCGRPAASSDHRNQNEGNQVGGDTGDEWPHEQCNAKQGHVAGSSRQRMDNGSGPGHHSTHFRTTTPARPAQTATARCGP